MYGFYGGFTTIFHTVVRYPVLVVCVGLGGVTYKALTCPPPPPPPAVVQHVILPPPPVVVVPLDPKPVEKPFRE